MGGGSGVRTEPAGTRDGSSADHKTEPSLAAIAEDFREGADAYCPTCPSLVHLFLTGYG